MQVEHFLHLLAEPRNEVGEKRLKRHQPNDVRGFPNKYSAESDMVIIVGSTTHQEPAHIR